MSTLIGVEFSDHLTSLLRPKREVPKDAAKKKKRARRISNESRRRNRR